MLATGRTQVKARSDLRNLLHKTHGILRLRLIGVLRGPSERALTYKIRYAETSIPRFWITGGQDQKDDKGVKVRLRGTKSKTSDEGRRRCTLIVFQ